MIDIIILFFLCKKIGKTAKEKGLGRLKWKLLTILCWFMFEGIGFNFALGWLGYEHINSITEMISILELNPSVMFFSLFCAFGGYLLVRFILENKETKEPAQ